MNREFLRLNAWQLTIHVFSARFKLLMIERLSQKTVSDSSPAKTMAFSAWLVSDRCDLIGSKTMVEISIVR